MTVLQKKKKELPRFLQHLGRINSNGPPQVVPPLAIGLQGLALIQGQFYYQPLVGKKARVTRFFFRLQE